MKDPELLLNVLYSLLGHPALEGLLKNPKALENYLEDGWIDLDPEADGWYQSAPDSQESSEAAELMPMVEQKLADLELTQEQRIALKSAMVQVCPDCREMLTILMPNSLARA